MLPLSKKLALRRLLRRYDEARMSITPDGWFTWAIRDPGPLSKTNGGRNTVRGFVPHSAEGYWPHLQTLLHSPARQASWGASNLKDGQLIQHYPIYVQTWTSGAGYPNNNFFSNETEGVAGEPLTDGQVANIVRQIRELSELRNWVPERPSNAQDVGATLYEHRECVRWGAEPTACPSGRIPWERILRELEDDMAAIQLVWNPDFQRLYVLGQGDPRWIASAAEADELRRAFGQEKVALSWKALQALGAK